MYRRRELGSFNWSNQHVASRLLRRSGLPSLHSRKVNAVGEAKCLGFGGAEADSETRRPCHTSLRRSPPGFPTAKVVPPPLQKVAKLNLPHRSCLTTNFAYSSFGPLRRKIQKHAKNHRCCQGFLQVLPSWPAHGLASGAKDRISQPLASCPPCQQPSLGKKLYLQ